MAASAFMSGGKTRNPDLIIFHLCKMLHCLPSDLENEDSAVLEKFLFIDSILNVREDVK